MGQVQPGEARYDTDGAAGFLARVPLARPTRIRITASGPLGFPEAIQSASTTLFIAPGQHITGDGIVLQLHGFIVEILTPTPGLVDGSSLPVRARIRMLCSCATEPDGLWPSPEVQVRLLAPSGEVAAEGELGYAGEPSTYEGSLEGLRPGAYELEVMALSRDRTNIGWSRAHLVVR